MIRSPESKVGARPRRWRVEWAPAERQYLACWRLTIGRSSPKWCTSLAGVVRDPAPDDRVDLRFHP